MIDVSSYQADLGVEVTLELFSSKCLPDIFKQAKVSSENARRMFLLKDEYIRTIDDVILFCKERNQRLLI